MKNVVRLLVALVASLLWLAATTTSAATFAYDARPVARVDTREIANGAAASPLVSGVREGSVSPSVTAQGTSTTSTHSVVATDNPVPGRVSRIVEEDVLDRGMTTLGHPSSSDVFVTAADDIAGLNSAQIGEHLTLLDGTGAVRKGPFAVIEFDTPGGIASPLNRTNPGFINGGRAAGGAREFVVPNSPLDQLSNVVIRRPG
jgi:hypothetical protein